MAETFWGRGERKKEKKKKKTIVPLFFLTPLAVHVGQQPHIMEKKKIYKRKHARTWLSLYKSIINRTIKEIRIHRFKLPKF